MKIGVVTLPLHTNYGGVLQAYALQYSLRSMGHDPYLVDCRLNPRYANFVKRPALLIVRALAWAIPSLADQLRSSERQLRADKVVMRHNVESFIAKNISLKHYLDYSFIGRRDFEAFVVGSDQVWRPEYFRPIAAAYLNFARKWSVKRVAYAASFGLDEWSYNESQGEQCRRLAKLFDAISVRENTAINLCNKYLERDAQEVLDPTLLLPKRVYLDLVEQANIPASSGNMMVAILDATPDKEHLVDLLAANYSASKFSVNSRVEDRSAPLEERIQPPVEQWLKGFVDADYVVTDSYHAAIFAIIFNRPFVVYTNPERGATRFHSLLSKLGLEQQMISSSEDLCLDSCFDIDWEGVNAKLLRLRRESLEFLNSALQA
ncbi:MAG: polysaccharide pyruvyl transferase family protein [Rikenellaceae bacterium]